MSYSKFILLLVLVIGSAGVSIWVVFLALQSDKFDGTVFRALVPLLLLGSISFRLLMNRHKEK